MVIAFFPRLVACIFYVIHVEYIRFYSPVEIIFKFLFALLIFYKTVEFLRG